MKKSIIILSAIIAASSVILTSCQAGKLVITDNEGSTHILYTDENGNEVQDNYGNVYQYVENANGDKVTELYSYPEIITNKSQSKIENCWVKIDVPKDWEVFTSTTSLRIDHKGDCATDDKTGCQLVFETDFEKTLEEKYNKIKENAEKLYSQSSDVRDVNTFETTICGVKAKAVSYRLASTNGTFYYYIMSNGYFTYSINAVVDNDCFKDSDSIVALLESCITMKNVVNKTTVTTTETTTALQTE